MYIKYTKQDLFHPLFTILYVHIYNISSCYKISMLVHQNGELHLVICKSIITINEADMPSLLSLLQVIEDNIVTISQ